MNIEDKKRDNLKRLINHFFKEDENYEYFLDSISDMISEYVVVNKIMKEMIEVRFIGCRCSILYKNKLYMIAANGKLLYTNTYKGSYFHGWGYSSKVFQHRSKKYFDRKFWWFLQELL